MDPFAPREEKMDEFGIPLRDDVPIGHLIEYIDRVIKEPQAVDAAEQASEMPNEVRQDTRSHWTDE
jgi:hypothetical protein